MDKIFIPVEEVLCVLDLLTLCVSLAKPTELDLTKDLHNISRVYKNIGEPERADLIRVFADKLKEMDNRLKLEFNLFQKPTLN